MRSSRVLVVGRDCCAPLSLARRSLLWQRACCGSALAVAACLMWLRACCGCAIALAVRLLWLRACCGRALAVAACLLWLRACWSQPRDRRATCSGKRDAHRLMLCHNDTAESLLNGLDCGVEDCSFFVRSIEDCASVCADSIRIFSNVRHSAGRTNCSLEDQEAARLDLRLCPGTPRCRHFEFRDLS